MTIFSRQSAFILALVLAWAHPRIAQPSTHDQLARDILEELIEIRSTAAAAENTVVAAEAMARRLLDAGFLPEDVQVVVGPGAQIGNLVVRYRAADDGQKPIRLSCHFSGSS